MFEGFTERSQKTFYFAAEEAQKMGHNFIGTEHALLGVADEGGQGAKILRDMGVTNEKIRRIIIEMEGTGNVDPTAKEIPLTPRTKRLVEVAKSEARALGHNFVAPEHILLGIIKESEGVAGMIIQKL
jgi:ATP-dependent Clp protease ATP-binding subunit ClpC